MDYFAACDINVGFGPYSDSSARSLAFSLACSITMRRDPLIGPGNFEPDEMLVFGKPEGPENLYQLGVTTPNVKNRTLVFWIRG